MNSRAKNDLEFVQIKAVAVAVVNAKRARRLHGETLGLPSATNCEMQMAFEGFGKAVSPRTLPSRSISWRRLWLAGLRVVPLVG
jgi:hypothetical protein